MKTGTLCYATDQGLGILAKSFYDNGIVTHPLVIEHPTHANHLDWYLGAPSIPIRNVCRTNLARDLCASVDAMMFFETPFDWGLIDWCASHGVKTVLMPMYECTPEPLPALPDYWFFPSLLDAQEFGVSTREPFGQWMGPMNRRGFLTPVPVNVPWRRRVRAEVFVHNAGHGSFQDRNGTEAILQSLPRIKSPANIIIRTQRPLYSDAAVNTTRGGGSIEYVTGTVRYDQLWNAGDVFMFPERFNGLSLPLQEARAAGMLVMATNRFPVNTWLPNPSVDGTPLLIPPSGYRRTSIGGPYRFFDMAALDPLIIAAHIDAWYGADISTYSDSGREWAEVNSWAALGPKYKELLTRIVEG